MKNFIFVLALILGPASYASSFSCLSPEGDEANLILKKDHIEWYDNNHSANSKGIYIGREDAPYDDHFNYEVFDLVDYYRTADSNFLLKLAPNFESRSEFDAVVVFNNDSHDEERTKFFCTELQ